MKKLKYILTIMCLYTSVPPLIAAEHGHIYIRGINGLTESFYISPNRKIIELKNKIARKFHINQATHKIILRHNGYAIFSDEGIIESYPYIYDKGLDFIIEPINPIIEAEEVIIGERIYPRREFWRERNREFREKRVFRREREGRRR
ncbi:MAG: hypothetical protein IBJ00_04180 [Alphaproteobacteria bacterium]|nr:hypothetical protein [Alphaproteobacteria bacterium]